jgi:small subunit ribosomal protein S21
MAKVRVRKNEAIEKVIRRFKRLVDNEGILRRAKECMFYEKPSAKKKKKKARAAKRKRKLEKRRRS